MRIERIDVHVVKIDHHYRLRGVAETPGLLPGTDYFFEPHWRQAYSRKLEACLVKITTDTGVSGWGEAQAPLLPEAPAVVIEHLFGPYLLGRDPLARVAIGDALYHANNVRGHGSGFTVDAIAGIDIALWDIAGRHFEAPIHVLMGGPCRTTLDAYVSGLRQPTLEAQGAAARELVDQGFGAFKLFLGHGVARDVEVLRAIRAAVGPDVHLMCDLLWRYDVDDARRVGRVLDAEDYRWLEAPVAPESIAGHAALARTLDTPIAVGETLRTAIEFEPWIAGGALGVAQPDVMRTGLSGALTIAGLCETHGIRIAPHVGVSTGVGMAATWQLAAALPGFLVQEYQLDLMAGAGGVLERPLEAQDGKLHVPDAPGLGVEVDEAAVQAATTQHWSLCA